MERARCFTVSHGSFHNKNQVTNSALGNALSSAAHADVEVHAVDTDSRVVLDAEIDVLGDTEAEVASLGEVALAQLVLLDLQATLENLLSLGAADSDVNGDLLVTADTEGTDGVASLACKVVSVGVRALKISLDPRKTGMRFSTYCRPGSVQKAARGPWPLW